MSDPRRKDRTTKEEDIVDVLTEFVDSRLENVHTSLPAQIVSYVEATRTAIVKLLVSLVRPNGDILEVPIIDNVPVMFPASATFTLTYPLLPGDKGIVIFAETGIGNYLAGTGDIEVEADSPARFQLTDAMFLPGVYPAAGIKPAPGFIKVDPTGIIAINGETDFAVRFTKLKEVVDELQSDITTLKNVFSTWTPVANDGGAALKTAATTWYSTALTKLIDLAKVLTVKLP